MKIKIFFLLALPCLVHAQDALNQHQRVITAASGVYDMSKEPRRYPFLLILDQEALKYPSFWAGGHAGGEITFSPETDLLTGDLELNAEGGFSLQVTNSTRKHGMEAQIPGGPWMQNTRDRNFRVTFDSFSDYTVGEVRRGNDGNVIEILAKAKGKVEVDGKEAPMEAKVRFLFQERTPNFTMHANFEFEGALLGLDGKQAGPIKATLSTLSPLGEMLPPKAGNDPSDPFGDLGF
ncbi:MAG: hypothetical protein JJU29_20720 [Verrucomicrobia bacterium]|nr:hypothetical protein [Verrucomicrobiota bacterium]MCH8512344.1 hypothetical protein [Kiritimatiellia bacterium]